MTDRTGFSGTDLLLAVLGGVAVGATVAYLTTEKTGKQRREQITDFVSTGREKARVIPDAVRSAGVAARDAFNESVRAAG
jgi:gas vesicle protein